MKKIFRNLVVYTMDAVIFIAIIVGLAKLGFPWLHLPGDVYIEDANGSSSYPFVSGIVIVILFSTVINLTGRFWKKIWPSSTV
jgi:hypothetical protein